MNAIHEILFNMSILYSIALGIWAAYLVAQNRPISGNYWGSVVTYALLNGAITLVGLIMTLQGLRPERIVTYYLYMAWLTVIMPGLFSMLRGRDDRNAAIAFALLAFFNAATSFSMMQRNIVSPWA
jgi:hypothetical protein